MKFLCLAYGAEEDWIVLSKDEQDALLAQDAVLQERGDYIAIVGAPRTVRNPARTPQITDSPFAKSDVTMVGFSIVEARNIDEAIELVSGTPCAVAGGAIEVRPIVS